MNDPLVFLVWQSLRNRIGSMVGKLRRPKYLLGVMAGLAYFWWFLIRPMLGVNAVEVFSGADPADVTLIAQSAVGLMFALLALTQTLSSERGLLFQENELLFLLAAPVSRGGLLRLKLLQPQPGILFSSLCFGYAIYRLPGGSWWAFPGVYVLFNLTMLLRTWWSLVLCRLHAQGVTIWMGWVGLLGLAVIAAAGWACFEPMERSLFEPPVTDETGEVVDSESLAAYLAAWIKREPLRYVLLPLRLTVSIATPGALGHRLAGMGLLAVWFALLGTLVFRSRVDFVGPSLDLASRICRIKSEGVWAWKRERAARQSDLGEGARPSLLGRLLGLRSRLRHGRARQVRPLGDVGLGGEKTGPRLSPPPFELRPTGPLWVAIFWKNMLCAGQKYTPRKFLYALCAAAVGGLALGLWPDINPRYPTVASGLALYGVLLYSLILSNMVRNDLRGDIPNFIYLRALPISGFQLLLGSVLGPTVILGGLAAVGWTFSACAVWQLGGQALPLLFKLPVYIAGLLLIYSVSFAFVTIENCLALTYPGWVQLGPAQQGGFDKMGQNMLSAIVRMFGLMLALIPPALVGVPLAVAGGFLAQGSLVGIGWAVLVGTLVFVAILLGEVVFALLSCARTVYPKFDISAEII